MSSWVVRVLLLSSRRQRDLILSPRSWRRRIFRSIDVVGRLRVGLGILWVLRRIHTFEIFTNIVVQRRAQE
jgi:hypothetical protein